ncbi:MAG: TolC family protein, partial [Desulfobulbaceae bacterium]|nr:TolC family protein [Desulfobulbaceae bacterium]
LPLTLPSDLLRQRPDIRAAERQLAAATATVGATVAELFPRFSVGALVGLQASSLGDLLSRSSRFWTIGPAVRWPLFDGGAIRAGIEISEARRDQARVGYEKTVLTAPAETEDALVALDRERVKQQQLATAVTAADQALTAARGLDTAGLTPFLNVLQSEATLFQARDRLAESDQRMALALIALYKALGGGWQTAAAEPHPAPVPPT